MKIADIIELFLKMYEEHWSYRLSAAKNKVVDCSGAFSYAAKCLGGYLPHGSNSLANGFTMDLFSTNSVDNIQDGYICFKTKDDETRKNNLDFYHCGLYVRGYVYNASSPKLGFVRSKINTGWSWYGPLKNVDYEPDPESLFAAKVITKEDPLNLRCYPDISKNNIITTIPKDTLVYVLDDTLYRTFYKVQIDNVRGYAYKKYLEKLED